jgi:hypothetical protein
MNGHQKSQAISKAKGLRKIFFTCTASKFKALGDSTSQQQTESMLGRIRTGSRTLEAPSHPEVGGGVATGNQLETRREL